MLSDTYHKYFQPFEQEQEKHQRLWFSLGREVGLMVIDDEKTGAEEDESEEDREVQKIMDHGRAVKRKILKGNTVYTMYVKHVESV